METWDKTFSLSNLSESYGRLPIELKEAVAGCYHIESKKDHL